MHFKTCLRRLRSILDNKWTWDMTHWTHQLLVGWSREMTVCAPACAMDNNKIRQMPKITWVDARTNQYLEDKPLEQAAKQVLESFESAIFLDKPNKTTSATQATSVIDERHQWAKWACPKMSQKLMMLTLLKSKWLHRRLRKYHQSRQIVEEASESAALQNLGNRPNQRQIDSIKPRRCPRAWLRVWAPLNMANKIITHSNLGNPASQTTNQASKELHPTTPDQDFRHNDN